MNRLVLIGNGFDLAHGLKTKYEHFIDWYWEEWGNRLMRMSDNSISDEFCSFKLNNIGISDWYLVRDWYYKKRGMEAKEFIQRVKLDAQLCDFEYKSTFFERINFDIETTGWVDIENVYYRFLTMVLENAIIPDLRDYEKLNFQLNVLKDYLIKYLKLEEKKKIIYLDKINEKIYRPVERREIAVGIPFGFSREDLNVDYVQLLNFNYTTTPELYLADNTTVNYIHGKLDKPQGVIFGYGDELDENYKRLKEQNDSECMRHVKSIRYLEHDNYRRMLEFIESGPFQTVIMGHSCGNSDRTLLNTIFEHPNCVSIKPYYHQIGDRKDNYSELTININRNFSDPKLMRDRVVCKDYCEPLIKKT